MLRLSAYVVPSYPCPQSGFVATVSNWAIFSVPHGLLCAVLSHRLAACFSSMTWPCWWAASPSLSCKLHPCRPIISLALPLVYTFPLVTGGAGGVPWALSFLPNFLISKMSQKHFRLDSPCCVLPIDPRALHLCPCCLLSGCKCKAEVLSGLEPAIFKPLLHSLSQSPLCYRICIYIYK